MFFDEGLPASEEVQHRAPSEGTRIHRQEDGGSHLAVEDLEGVVPDSKHSKDPARKVLGHMGVGGHRSSHLVDLAEGGDRLKIEGRTVAVGVEGTVEVGLVDAVDQEVGSH